MTTPTDYGARMMWEGVCRTGVMGLTRQDWARLAPDLSPIARAVLRSFLEQLEGQSRWVAERTAATRDEADRIVLIGQTMRRAGLRSYTDEKGRIFVAGDT